MFGSEFILYCPSCKKLYINRLGHTTFLKYKEKSLIHTDCINCGAELASDFAKPPERQEFLATNRKFRYVENLIRNLVADNLDVNLDEDSQIQKVLDLVYEKEPLTKDYEYEIKSCIQYYLASFTCQGPKLNSYVICRSEEDIKQAETKNIQYVQPENLEVSSVICF